MTEIKSMTIPTFSKRVRRAFEPYDSRIGCVACRKEDHWWIAVPNGEGIICPSEQAARDGAQFINLTADDDERATWG